jgi:hypothetical protein
MPVAAPPPDAVRELTLDALSAEVGISKQTLVTWVDRGLVEARLAWGTGAGLTAVRLIRLTPPSLDFLRTFAAEYRADTVSRTEARRLLRLIDRNQVQRLIRQGRVATKRVDGETRLDVGSIEDYLRALEASASRAD